MIAARIRRKAAALAHGWKRRARFARPFRGDSRHRLLLLSLGARIPQSQIFPFHFYAADLARLYGAELREADIDAFMAGRGRAPGGATVVCFQSEFDISDAALEALVARIRARNPAARLVYLDWFAPTDLRLAHRVGPMVDVYLTKHLLRDRARYGRPVAGDTTLMDHYGRVFGLDHAVTHFPIPEGFWGKLLLGPTFLTADFMLPVFARGRRPDRPRPIDLHARIAVGGTPWYAAMRGQCLEKVAALRGARVVTGTGVGHHRFLTELAQSKVCFSPFGYGEVCWRDFEAVMSGAVLLKQDMSHVETAPDIFEDGETYVGLRWDLADFDDKLHWLLRDDAARGRIAGAAFERLHDYAASDAFAWQMAPLFEARHGAKAGP